MTTDVTAPPATSANSGNSVLSGKLQSIARPETGLSYSFIVTLIRTLSPNYLGTSGTIALLDYDNNVNQDWVVQSDCSAADGIIITAVQFTTETNYDKVTITVSGTDTEYTGELGSFEHIVDSTSFTLNFYSDGSVTASGFEFNWQCHTGDSTTEPTTDPTTEPAATTGMCLIS